MPVRTSPWLFTSRVHATLGSSGLSWSSTTALPSELICRVNYIAIFEPLRDLRYFQMVAMSKETNTTEWPNGADFVPEFLYYIVEEAPVN